MGWNDHVMSETMKCLACGEVDHWEMWDDVAKARYGGELGKKLGHDITKGNCCPNCGSTKGVPCDEDEE